MKSVKTAAYTILSSGLLMALSSLSYVITALVGGANLTGIVLTFWQLIFILMVSTVSSILLTLLMERGFDIFTLISHVGIAVMGGILMGVLGIFNLFEVNQLFCFLICFAVSYFITAVCLSILSYRKRDKSPASAPPCPTEQPPCPQEQPAPPADAPALADEATVPPDAEQPADTADTVSGQQ